MRKILYICADAGVPVLGRKGASVHVRQMVEAMVRARHPVVVAARTLQKSPWETPAPLDVPIIHIRPAADAVSTLSAVKEFNSRVQLNHSMAGDLRRILYNHEMESELSRRFDSDPPDLIYERASLYSVAGLWLGQRFKRPVVLELNAPLALEQSAYRETPFTRMAEEVERWMLRSADAVFVVSEALRKHVADLVERNNVHVVPNGVDATLFFPAEPDLELRKRLGLDGAEVIGFVGGLRPWHGVEILPELLDALAPQHPSLKLLIVGDGPLRQTLAAAFERKEHLGKVVFAGTESHDEIPRLIRQFDVAVAPYPVLSHDFYFSPLKIFEYLACGIATVAADLGQISEIIHPEKTGLLYPPGDLSALVRACHALLEDGNLRRQLGTEGAARVHAHYTWDQNVRVLEQVARAGALPPPG